MEPYLNNPTDFAEVLYFIPPSQTPENTMGNGKYANWIDTVQFHTRRYPTTRNFTPNSDNKATTPLTTKTIQASIPFLEMTLGLDPVTANIPYAIQPSMPFLTFNLSGFEWNSRTRNITYSVDRYYV